MYNRRTSNKRILTGTRCPLRDSEVTPFVSGVFSVYRFVLLFCSSSFCNLSKMLPVFWIVYFRYSRLFWVVYSRYSRLFWIVYSRYSRLFWIVYSRYSRLFWIVYSRYSRLFWIVYSRYSRRFSLTFCF